MTQIQQKPKLKVGKKLTTNASHTDTSFKSRAIVVRTQSIQRAANVDALNAAAAAASDTLTTSAAPVIEVTTRHQTVRDLLSQFNHPSAAVRRDAVLGIIELSERFRGSPCSSSARSSTLSNTSFLRRNVHAVMASIVRLLVDEERAVRKVVLQFMRECFVRDISEVQ